MIEQVLSTHKALGMNSWKQVILKWSLGKRKGRKRWERKEGSEREKSLSGTAKPSTREVRTGEPRVQDY